MHDPIVSEVRRARDEHARSFGYDLAAICEDIRKHQLSCGHPVVRLGREDGDANKSMLVPSEARDVGIERDGS